MGADYCTSCGAKRLPDARFCGTCGTSLEAFGASVTRAAPPGPIETQAPYRGAPVLPVALVVVAVMCVVGLAIWQWPRLTGTRSDSGQEVFGEEVIAPPEPRIVMIDPAAWDPSASSWTEYGPSYESSPGITALGATHAHAFGSSIGALTYAFDIDDGASGTATVTARLSSEHANFSAPVDWVSDVTLLVNGNSVGTLQVIADDGSGQPYTWDFDASLLQSGTNWLSFWVYPDSANRNGLCIYGQSLVADQPGAVIELTLP